MKKFIIHNSIFIILFLGIFWVSEAQAATLFISPSSGSFSVGSSFTVSVRSNTQGAVVNTAEASITYPTDTLDLVSVSQGLTFYLPAPGSPNRGSGTAYFAGGLPTPGYNGSSGIVGSMRFRAKAVGAATISIFSGKVLLNDGQGTNALAGTSGARFAITEAVAAPSGAVGSPEVSSSSHPDQQLSYDNNDVTLAWTKPEGAFGYSFSMDQNPDTVPDDELDATDINQVKYIDLEDGVWYFHIKARADVSNVPFSETTHFKLQIEIPEKIVSRISFLERKVSLPVYILLLLILIILILFFLLFWLRRNQKSTLSDYLALRIKEIQFQIDNGLGAMHQYIGDRRLVRATFLFFFYLLFLLIKLDIYQVVYKIVMLGVKVRRLFGGK